MKNVDTVYCDRLKTNIFKTEEQKLSFITGAFIKFGGHNDTIHYISISNSVSKVQILTKLFEEMNCRHVNYEWNSGYISAFEKRKLILQ